MATGIDTKLAASMKTGRMIQEKYCALQDTFPFISFLNAMRTKISMFRVIKNLILPALSKNAVQLVDLFFRESFLAYQITYHGSDLSVEMLV